MLNLVIAEKPSVAMIVEREDKIANFIKEPFYVVEAVGGDIKADREKVKDKATAEGISAESNFHLSQKPLCGLNNWNISHGQNPKTGYSPSYAV